MHTHPNTGGDLVVCVSARNGVCVVTAVQTRCMHEGCEDENDAGAIHSVNKNQWYCVTPADMLRIGALDSARKDSAV